jgi:hypothetical protein
MDSKSKDHHLVVSKVNLQPKFRNGKYLSGVFDVSRLQNENLRETFQGKLNTKLESLKLDNVKDG